ncbi:MAG: alpha/beta fold hydrolase [Actinomycetota bacterium]|nr:alpha/beta fold hydrolase [Actinomycetota bacterium]
MQPASVLLLHGGGSGPEIFSGWKEHFPDSDFVPVDLHEGLRIETARMEDYAARAVDEGRHSRPPVLMCGWSMGGLVAMMAARQLRPGWLALLEPSPPAEVQGVDETVTPRRGTFDPEVVYRTFPEGVSPRRESSYARSQRKRGIFITTLPCPTLVVFGRDFPDERGRSIAAAYDAAAVELEDLDHWGLVLDRRVARVVSSWAASTRPAR